MVSSGEPHLARITKMADGANHITVFVSYSWEGQEHLKWVTRLADHLDREPDIQVTFDQYDLFAGKDLTHFMERGLKCDRIVIVSTPEYVRKVSERVGGVGYEGGLITADLIRDMAQDKFIPALREGDGVPSFLQTKLRVDFRDPTNYEVELSRLLEAIRRQAPANRPSKRGLPGSSLKDPPNQLTLPEPTPRLQATLPRVQRGYQEKNGILRLGQNPNPNGETFWIALATFKNQPSSEHARSRDAKRVAASVHLKLADDFPQTGLWLGASGRFVDLDIYAPAQSVVLAVVGKKYAALVGDNREINGGIDYQTFWLAVTTTEAANIIVRLVEAGSVLVEVEYRLKLADMPGFAPQVNLLAPS
jgi:TIR domain